MLDTQMNAVAIAKKLRARRAELKKKHTAALKLYGEQFEQWKLNLGNFMVATARKRAATITREQARRRYGNGVESHLCEGAPEPPKYPSDELIRKIDGMLRHMAITEQKTFKLTTSDVEALFVDKDSTEDDE